MRFDSMRLLARILFGLLILLQAESMAQSQVVSDAETKNQKSGVDQRSQLNWDFSSRRLNALKIKFVLQKSTDVNFADIPLIDALNSLKQAHQLAIWVDQKSLSDEGISVDQPVTLALSDVSLKNTLHFLLSPLLLDYVVKDNVMIITSCTVAEEYFENRVYNTSRIPGLTPVELKEIITRIVAPGGWNTEKPVDAIVPANPNVAPTGTSSPADAPAGSATAPVNNADSSRGSICAIGNTLVIRQTYRVHEEIIDLLEQLEKQQAASVNVKPTKP